MVMQVDQRDRWRLMSRRRFDYRPFRPAGRKISDFVTPRGTLGMYRQGRVVLSLLLGISLIAGACGSDDDAAAPAATTAAPAATTAAPAATTAAPAA
ncbi:uncharacterized protein METZ01_LOCUS408363, partial [marine metagenome]